MSAGSSEPGALLAVRLLERSGASASGGFFGLSELSGTPSTKAPASDSFVWVDRWATSANRMGAEIAQIPAGRKTIHRLGTFS